MLQNAYLLSRIGADTAENESTFAEIWQKYLARAASEAFASWFAPVLQWSASLDSFASRGKGSKNWIISIEYIIYMIIDSKNSRLLFKMFGWAITMRTREICGTIQLMAEAKEIV